MTVRPPRASTALAVPLLLALTPAQEAPGPLLGFTPAGAEAQRALEARFDATLERDNLESWMRELTDKPFYVDSEGAHENADFLVERFESWGYETRVDEYQVLFPMPVERVVEMTAPVRYRARLEEPVLEEDATSGVEPRLPPYNAYSAEGDVEAELVYVNYGIPSDYEALERRGVSVEGKVVIARYGGSWRGIKPKVAAEHGAVAAFLYSDPRDDGYWQGDVYPEGPYRMEHGIQRGSVSDMPRYPGDPLTPGVGATEDAERYTVEESPTIMKIPVLPMSYADAQPLLEQLGGPVAPPSWRGALPITYHVGPGPARVRVKLDFDWELRPARNVVALMEGSTWPDEWVVRGNHRDGWAMGAADPISGLVALMEEARAVGALAAAGDRPGLLGSTEWAEHHADELREKAVAYVNTDGSGRGFLRIGGSHTLERFANQLGEDVEDPQTGVSVNQRLRAQRGVSGEDVLDGGDMPISPLGSGSDYTPFLQHLGIASLNVSFGGENGGGSYHSVYDSFDHYTRFGDPGFHYGVALAKVTGRATLRLANAEVVPLRFTNFADRVDGYLDEVQALADDLRTEHERRARLAAMDAYRLAADPTETYVPPEAPAPVPHLNFAPLENAVTRLERAAAAYDRALEETLASGDAISDERVRRINELLVSTERRMTREEGLPRRPWFRHMIYAPGFYTGYGVKTLPGVREGIEEGQYEEAREYVDKVAGTLGRVTDAVRRATEIVERRSGDGGTPG